MSGRTPLSMSILFSGGQRGYQPRCWIGADNARALMAVATRPCHRWQATGSAAICQRHSRLRPNRLLRRRQAVCEPRACGSQGKAYDLLALSNLCIDVVVPVDDVTQLGDQQARRGLLDDLHSRTFSEDSWELGGSMNTMIAAARLGLRVGAIGHMGDDAYGRWCARELEVRHGHCMGIDVSSRARMHSTDTLAAPCARRWRASRPSCPSCHLAPPIQLLWTGRWCALCSW